MLKAVYYRKTLFFGYTQKGSKYIKSLLNESNDNCFQNSYHKKLKWQTI